MTSWIIKYGRCHNYEPVLLFGDVEAQRNQGRCSKVKCYVMCPSVCRTPPSQVFISRRVTVWSTSATLSIVIRTCSISQMTSCRRDGVEGEDLVWVQVQTTRLSDDTHRESPVLSKSHILSWKDTWWVERIPQVKFSLWTSVVILISACRLSAQHTDMLCLLLL